MHMSNTLTAEATETTSLVSSNDMLSQTLRRYWGYEAFRPGQEAVVRAIEAGRDACVVMPTGGGKPLCYQLPAVLDGDSPGLVVSPASAPMREQVAQVGQMGIPA